MRFFVCLLVSVLLATACGDGDSDEAAPATSSSVDSPSGVPASIGGIIDGDISGDINVLGYVVIDESGTRFCSVLLESFPPQCGAPSVDLVDLDTTAIDLQEEQGVQWTDDIVILLGRYSDGTFTVLDVGEPQEPLPGDTPAAADPPEDGTAEESDPSTETQPEDPSTEEPAAEDEPVPVADVPCDAEPEVMSTAAGVDFVRTPDACFDGLPDWPYEPHYVEIDGLRQAYVDEGPADGDVVLLLHGQPSWSYLYRDMIAVLSDAGHRVIAMDHLGMGRSDKPVQLDSYSYLGHNARLETFIAELGLTGINVFVQDWGSLIGLRVVGLNPDLFATVAIGDGTLPVVPDGFQPFPVEIDDPDESVDIASPFAQFPEQQVPFYDGCELIVEGGGDFGAWIRYSMTAESFRPSEVLEALTWFDLTDGEEAAYDAPFPSRIYMGGPRTFPSLVNELGGQNAEAWEGLTSFDRPVLTLWASNDPGNLGQCATQENLIADIAGARNQPHDRLPESSHFLQDDQGTEIANRLVDWYANPGDPNADRIGFELLERMDDGTIRAWISTDPTMTIEDFDAIDAPANWIKNQPREGSSGDSSGRFLGSPGSEGTIVYEDFFGSTWFHSATVIEIGVPVDAEGVLRGAMVQKFHEISYEPGSTVVALVSPDGDRYIRIGRDAGRTSDDPTLPTGWTLDEIDLPDGLTTLLPPDGTLVIRTDNEDSFQGPVADLP